MGQRNTIKGLQGIVFIELVFSDNKFSGEFIILRRFDFFTKLRSDVDLCIHE